MSYVCILCNIKQEGLGNNPYPVDKKGAACNRCYKKIVLPRLNRLNAWIKMYPK